MWVIVSALKPVIALSELLSQDVNASLSATNKYEEGPLVAPDDDDDDDRTTRKALNRKLMTLTRLTRVHKRALTPARISELLSQTQPFKRLSLLDAEKQEARSGACLAVSDLAECVSSGSCWEGEL